MSDTLRAIMLWIYWITGFTLVGWNLYNHDMTKAIIYLVGAIVFYLIIFQMIWRKKRRKERGESSFFDFLDCDGLDCDCDGGGGGGFDGGGFGGGD